MTKNHGFFLKVGSGEDLSVNGSEGEGTATKKGLRVIHVLCVFRGSNLLKNQNRMSGV